MVSVPDEMVASARRRRSPLPKRKYLYVFFIHTVQQLDIVEVFIPQLMHK